MKKTASNALEFYQNNKYSQQLPGKKDCISNGKNVHVSKQLILSKWCNTVDPNSAHSVCVYTAHQNVKLLLPSVNLSKDYHELLELIVCNRNSKEHMIHCCESCPGVNAVKTFIEGELVKADDDG